ncbi:FtsX-like permease family protein [Paraflavisolibacter sp. H34]|uniref:ABC transporter permease n=1 Tax=Huijunlia imazamoxiresistens TaxID=3127457 RepID=UPI003018B247
MNASNFRWLLKMAWRDSRRNRSRLLLFVSSIVLGIAALVAIYSFEQNLRDDIHNQAKELLGADLEISGNKAPGPPILPLLDSLGDERSQEWRFASMVYFPKGGGTRLVQVRALEGGYPYYGAIETTPAGAGTSFRQGRQAVVDKTLLLQFGAQVGDSVKLGEVTFAIRGALEKAPGQTGISSTVAPVVYIPLRYLEATGLSQKGSRIRYAYYYKWNRPANIERLVTSLEPRLQPEALYTETVESQKRETGRSFADLTRFLSLVGFIALLLGCVGVASAIHVYIREKLSSIAVLRCLGVRSGQAFLIYLFQIVCIGLVGSLAGALLGVGLQQLLPLLLRDLLPLDISVRLSWTAVGQGIGLGLVVSVLFALLPLLSVRNISPLNTLRLSYEPPKVSRDPLRWGVYLLLVLFVFGFAVMHMRNWKEALWFTAGLLAALGVLSGIALLVVKGVRRFLPSSWNYLWRQGFANLFRPNNQTLVLVVTVGLGTAFICTLYFIQALLVQRVTLSSQGSQPNMVLFDIQPAQQEAVAGLTRRYRLPVIQQVPVVTMRLEAINGKDLSATLASEDTTAERKPGRAFMSEYRVTYRDSLIDSEKLTAGKWVGAAAPGDTVPVSVDENFARRLHVGLGDQLLFNVQGVLIPTVVGSLRQVEWNRVQTNFRVVFPRGVLEQAPQFHVLMTRVPAGSASARFQQAVVRQFPNVSLIDLNLILKVLDAILDKIGFVIRFMAGFSMATGLLVLVASVLTSKFQRIQESVLLRTLGASRRQIRTITALEYLFLGVLAAVTGILLSLAASWALARYTFETAFRPQVLPALLLTAFIPVLTMVIGLLNSRDILRQPPLEVLRKEG